jgi:hypothetical protein
MYRLASAALLLSLGACAARTPPIEVTRFNLGTPIERGSVAVRANDGQDQQSLAFRLYAGAVSDELGRVGYVPGQEETSLYLATVDIATGTRAALATRSPVSIGIGGGTGGFRGGGVGLGASFGLGGRPRDTVVTELRVQMTRRSDGTTVWEGRAQGEAQVGTDAADPDVAARRLAAALFSDFPGNNGETVSVR